jgi:predicted RNase H-like HicB family nuclease
MMSGKVSVIIEQDEHGCYELKGCQSQGKIIDETLPNIREAIDIYLETLTDEERTAALSREILATAVALGGDSMTTLRPQSSKSGFNASASAAVRRGNSGLNFDGSGVVPFHSTRDPAQQVFEAIEESSIE